MNAESLTRAYAHALPDDLRHEYEERISILRDSQPFSAAKFPPVEEWMHEVAKEQIKDRLETI